MEPVLVILLIAALLVAGMLGLAVGHLIARSRGAATAEGLVERVVAVAGRASTAVSRPPPPSSSTGGRRSICA
ncbi:MAG: hypothetical protein R2695_11650 [Acidimicrobiales bacterium]